MRDFAFVISICINDQVALNEHVALASAYLRPYFAPKELGKHVMHTIAGWEDFPHNFL